MYEMKCTSSRHNTTWSFLF